MFIFGVPRRRCRELQQRGLVTGMKDPKSCRDLDPGEVDGRLPLMRRIVGHPEHPVVPDEPGVARVAAAGKGEHRLVVVERHARERGLRAAGIGAAGGPERAVGEAEEVGAAQPVLRLLPAPVGVRRVAVADPAESVARLAAHEGEPFAKWLNSLGIAAFVLKYRLTTDGYHVPAALLDAARAIRTVRAHAVEWGIDPHRIGMIGQRPVQPRQTAGRGVAGDPGICDNGIYAGLL